METNSKKPRIVVIGAGFGGLWAARMLADRAVDVVVIDRNNYHTFLALLYQVAAAELNAEDIAYPVRSVFWNKANIRFELAHARRVDPERRRVETDRGSIDYDYLILATGSVTSTFGVAGVEKQAYFLKTLEEAVALKNHIICCFEAAAGEADEEKRKALLTFVIVGGGATGVEYSGALTELVHGPLAKDYPGIDFSEVRIILLEAAPHLVASMPADIRAYTTTKLKSMGVDVRLSTAVAEVLQDKVIIDSRREGARPFSATSGETLSTHTVVWTAGVRGEELPGLSGIPVGRDGRVPVEPTLQVVNRPDVYVIGDLAAIREDARVLPMVAQVAIQSGVKAARNILRQIAGRSPEPFSYADRGSMIAIGRKAAGVAIGRRTFKGFFAWILWLVIHLANLIGFRNRVMVLTNWAWDYLLYERAVRYVFPSGMPAGSKSCACAPPADASENVR
ncbi:MAG: NAD(P)/FAD-dependent oxidoreductase [Deltaproteobacteria bacterium]|jgi:NADH dehydrogenase|nr:NAD(P)/FAD-dependent oxidoreductase [Syntrophaceae bacterium]